MLLCFVLLIPLLTCRNSKIEQQDSITPSLQEGAEGFVLVDTKGEKKNWVLKADRALSFSDSITLYNLSVEFFDAEGIYNSTLTSDSGVVYSGSGDMSARGHVVVISKDTTMLKTSYLDWDNKRQKIVTEDAVEITKKYSIITGQGMESDPNLEHIKIKKDFNAVARDVHEE
jgi:LPS export ABC transporter protein LptC